MPTDNLMEALLAWERDAFLAINGTRSVWLDVLFGAFRGTLIWFPTVIVPLALLFKRPLRKWLPAVAILALTPLISMLITESGLKPLFERLRPTSHPAFMHVVVLLDGYRANGLYGFVSGHTASAVSFAVLSARLLRHRTYTIAITLWAALMGYSRIYLGAHFITDVVGGALVGVALAAALHTATQAIATRIDGR